MSRVSFLPNHWLYMFKCFYTSILAHGLWNSNAGVGEALFKLGQHGDCIDPIKESVALLEAERKNIDREITRLKQFLRRASRRVGTARAGNGYCESDSSVATVATSIQPPRILNTLQVIAKSIIRVVQVKK